MHECVNAFMPCVRQGNPLDCLDGRMGLQGAKDPPSRAKPTKSVSEANPLRWVAPCYALAWYERERMNVLARELRESAASLLQAPNVYIGTACLNSNKGCIA